MSIIWQTINDEYDIPVNFESLNVWGPDVVASMRAQLVAVGVEGDQLYYQTRGGQTLGPFDLPVSEVPGPPGDEGPEGPVGPSGGAQTTNLSSLRWPLYISHRGAARCYPEHSLEGYRASFEAGFTPEADIRALSDGTLVCIHDATTTRTMDISGNVSATTPAQWRAARINPPESVDGLIAGTGWGTPVFFEDYLDEFGGRTVLFIELKVTGAPVTAALQAINDRGLQQSVIVQSFDLPTCEAAVAAGVTALYLTSSATPASIVAAGIDYVGVSLSATNAYVTSLKSAGLRVIAYTATTKAQADAQIARGCDGVFCDDPWDASRVLPPVTHVDLSDGFIPPGSAFARDNSAITPAGTTQRLEVEEGALWFFQDETEDRSSSLRLGALGYGGPSLKIRFWVQSYPPQANANAWLVGVYLGSQSGDAPVNEEPGDGKFRLVMIRRDGRKHVYEKRTDGASTTQPTGSPTAATTPPYAPSTGRSEPMLFELEFTATTVAVRNLTRNDTDLVVSHTAWADTGDLYVTIRTKAALAKVWGIHAVRP